MKKMMLPFLALILLASCNSENKTSKISEEQQMVDSLWKKIDKVHIDGMKRMPKLATLQNTIQKSLDSISKLPSKNDFS